jgi:hypothetical protein
VILRGGVYIDCIKKAIEVFYIQSMHLHYYLGLRT